jgi:hypothetical protein
LSSAAQRRVSKSGLEGSEVQKAAWMCAFGWLSQRIGRFAHRFLVTCPLLLGSADATQQMGATHAKNEVVETEIFSKTTKVLRNRTTGGSVHAAFWFSERSSPDFDTRRCAALLNQRQERA